jgi:phage tail sheath protein FI
MDHQTALSTAGNTKTGTAFDNASTSAHIVFRDALTGGTDDLVPTAAELSLAWDKFGDAETVDVNLLIGGPSQTNADATGDTMATKVIDTAEGRKDCVAFISPARADVVNVTNPIAQTANVKAFADGLASSSYAVVDSGYKYMYDKYNAVYRFVPLNGDIAGLCARTDSVADAWFSPAGFSRGQVRGAIKLAFDPTNAQRDELYKARVNPVVTFPGQGTVLFGDKTMQTKPSAFDRINVRRLFIVLEKAIATAAKFQLFEFNDEFTRANFRNLIEPFLRDVQGRRGITDFSVVCDETNNTSALIDRNEFVADIFIKPNRSINFIQLNFVATRTGVAFSEVAGA